MSFESDWRRCVDAVNAALDARLPSPRTPPARLHEAMRYATMNGGKRFRAIVVMMTGEILGTDVKLLAPPAAAVECIHAYSLVHDDLPAMDDDDVRRGQPACHIKFGEATAILAGDALQALAFKILSTDADLVTLQERRNILVATLSDAVGSTGMAGGQEMDLAASGAGSMQYDLDTIHRLKTAALIQCSVRLGALVSDSCDKEVYEALGVYGECVGLAFQCKDDALDGENEPEQMLKKASKMRDQAIDALSILKHNTENLERIAEFVVSRSF